MEFLHSYLGRHFGGTPCRCFFKLGWERESPFATGAASDTREIGYNNLPFFF